MNSPFQNLVYRTIMTGRPSSKKPTVLGNRLAAFRKEARLSQVQLAKALDIPQRTVSFYEREAKYIPSNLLEPLSDILGVSIEDVVGIGPATKKRGPKSKLERLFDSVKSLPRNDQKFVQKFLEQVVERSIG